MIIVLKAKVEEKKVKELSDWLNERQVKVVETKGENNTILGLVGDTASLDMGMIRTYDIVDEVLRVQEPYKQASRKFHPQDSVVEVCGLKIGGGNFQVIAGPCSVESENQILTIADSVKKCGARMLRGGAFKPRTSPYAFQGLQGDGVELLLKAKAKTGMPIVSEIMSAEHLPLFENVDIIQVGARNMQNFELLKILGKTNKPILLKRGLSNTIDELLMSAEYILAGGNKNVILCERGIRTFETATRNTLDVSAIATIKKRSHLPIIIDPSHSGGYSEYVESLSLASVAGGADGLIIEVHNDPKNALCDGAQSLTPDAFERLMRKITPLKSLLSRGDIEFDEFDAEKYKEHVGDFVSISSLNKKATVGCQGVAGSYSSSACKNIFGKDKKLSFYSDFESVFKATESGEIEYGVLPIDNSIAGSVYEVYDLISKYNVNIVSEHTLKINHCLLAKKELKLNKIEKVLSHEQALYQCKGYLNKNKLKFEQVANTAIGAEMVANSSENIVAIGSIENAEIYNLKVLDNKIQDIESNQTRFIVITKNKVVLDNSDKISLMLTLDHKQNALFNLLQVFNLSNINMTKIESRPIPDKEFEIMFFIDFEGSLSDSGVKTALSKLGKVVKGEKRVLGAYSKI